jgi:hypothetical protein
MATHCFLFSCTYTSGRFETHLELKDVIKFGTSTEREGGKGMKNNKGMEESGEG